MDNTTLSSKGQVIIPKSVRDELQWAPGTVFRVVARDGGVLLTPEPLFAGTQPAQAAGCLKLAVRRGKSTPEGADDHAIDLALRQRAADEDRASHGGKSPP